MSTRSAKLGEYRRKRDFSRTREPKGGTRKRPPRLAYVIQKHAASSLHYDLRLELDGVMKSWAVPKGPSLDPAVKRLAIHVEDHPIEYNQFEGTIPAGEYGGGTVMIWDYGTYTAVGDAEDPEAALRAGYRKGDFKFVVKGKRLKGSWVLVRTKGRGDAGAVAPDQASRRGGRPGHRSHGSLPDLCSDRTVDGRNRRRTIEEEQPMTGRPSVGLADLEEVARRIAEGRLSNRPECTLEVSTYVWNRNSFEAQERFEDTCAEHGVRFAVVERIGGIEWACP